MTVQVVILAAGLGTRLGKPHPKPLTPLASGESIMRRAVNALRRAYGVAVSVAQRAARAMAVERGYSRHLLAVGVLDELSVPVDPDPAATAEAQANPRRQNWTASDTRRRHLDEYAKPLERADLTLLRLPPAGDAEQVLDQIADRRRNYLKPTILAGVVLPQDFADAYGDGIATRFGFARRDGTTSATKPVKLTVLDLDLGRVLT